MYRGNAHFYLLLDELTEEVAASNGVIQDIRQKLSSNFITVELLIKRGGHLYRKPMKTTRSVPRINISLVSLRASFYIEKKKKKTRHLMTAALGGIAIG